VPSPKSNVHETLSPFASLDVDETVTSCPGIDEDGEAPKAVKVGAEFAATEVVTVVNVVLGV
jgi:hypothetical protein